MRFKHIETFPGEKNFDVFLSLNEITGGKSTPVMPHLKTCFILLKDNKPVGRCALYDNPGIRYEHQRTAILGSFECISDLEVAGHLINSALEWCKAHSFEYLIGPMEGSTWENHRFFDSFDQPAFLSETSHPNYYLDFFRANGFGQLAAYMSMLEEPIQVDHSVLRNVGNKISQHGINIRNIDTDKLDEELIKIARFSNKSFENNFLFTPIDPTYFVEKYQSLKSLIKPEFAFIAEKKGQMVGLIFGFPDKERDAFVLKTLAKNNVEETKGLGILLTNLLAKAALQNGFTRFIHAFMIQDNNSLQMSKVRQSTVYRNYSLYGRSV